MGFLKKLRGNHSSEVENNSNIENPAGAPPGPPLSHQPYSPSNQASEKSSEPTQSDRPLEPPPARHEYAPPAGPPPGRGSDAATAGPPRGRIDYSPSPGPPPGQTEYSPPLGPPPGRTEYSPPPGPPPGRTKYAPPSEPHDYEPPAGPPPAQIKPGDAPPPYHDWTIIPDTALLPPPPSLGHENSPANNASRADADKAHEWCSRHPLILPHQPTSAQCAGVMNGDIGLLTPHEFRGHLAMASPGTWTGKTQVTSADCCIVTSSPLYFAFSDSPWQTEVTKTIYFEVKLRSLGHGSSSAESSIALGFCAMPYPTWRLPGWERGSLAVHGDDGRRYVNDTWGGKDFTSAFKTGDTVGLGMSISAPASTPEYGALVQASPRLKVGVFFTRNGRVEGEWNLHEELDASRDLGVEGLDGQFDLYGAIGCFGGVQFDCLFTRRDWLWLPR